MKLSLLLAQRQALLAQAQLANLAFAYAKLSEIARRITRAQLHGMVSLRQATPEAGEPGWTPLLALEGNQSVIDEHFTDEELIDCADAIAFLTGETGLELTFRLEELSDRFVVPLRHRLEEAGVIFNLPAESVEPSQSHRTTD